jgi:hypothetical protein
MASLHSYHTSAAPITKISLCADSQATSWDDALFSQFSFDSNSMVADLDQKRRKLVEIYAEHTGKSPALAKFVHAIYQRYPKYLRVTELFETFECYKRIGQEIYEQWRAGKIGEIYDLACGHGLLGVLLAHRFPALRVTCVDKEKRPAFDMYVQAAQDVGIPVRNIRYITDDIKKQTISPSCFVICIHGCNEATLESLTIAAYAKAAYATMPCCIRDGIYLKRIKHVDDRTRFNIAVGVIAGRFAATKITAIDERITNRNLIILG